MQDMDTDIYETHHKVMKQAGRETNFKNETFERDQTKRMSHSQSIVQLAASCPAFSALVHGDIKASQIQEEGPRRGVYMTIPSPPQTGGADAAAQPITLDRVSNDQRTVNARTPQRRMSFLVRHPV